MAKVVITFEDTDHGTVNITTEFDPPVKKGDEVTSAQQLAFVLMDRVTDALHEQSGVHEDE